MESNHTFWSIGLLAFGALLICIWRWTARRRTRTSTEQRVAPEKPPLQSDSALHSILPADSHSVTRGDWVIRLGRYFEGRHAGRYNVLVINAALEKSLNIEDEDTVETFQTMYAATKKEAVKFEVYVFRKGALVNLGDGGYINWYFSGNESRTGMSVRFGEIAGA